MRNLAHNVHFHLNLLIEHAVLHESTFLKFLGGKRDSIELVSDLVYCCKGSLANARDFVVFRATFPLLYISARRS